MTQSNLGWKREFEEPSRSRALASSSRYRTPPTTSCTLPKAEQNLPEWQTAIACLIGAADGRDFLMHARIGMPRTLNRHVERVFNPDRKDPHCGMAQAGEGSMLWSQRCPLLRITDSSGTSRHVRKVHQRKLESSHFIFSVGRISKSIAFFLFFTVAG